ncbi:MAG: hypothetical protein WDO24_22265 [Pseudomonadota bacterium]
MKLFDLHSHWATERGYPLRSAAALAVQQATWNSKPSYVSEAEMVFYLRQQQVRTILDFGFTKACRSTRSGRCTTTRSISSASIPT